VSDTDLPRADALPAGDQPRERPEFKRRPRRRRSRISRLTMRILAVNFIALGILVGGLFYLDEFRQGLIAAQIRDIELNAEIIAGALAEAATTGPEATQIERSEAMQILNRLVVPAQSRARLYARDGVLLVDSRDLAVGNRIVAEDLPPRGTVKSLLYRLERNFQDLVDMVAKKEVLPPYHEPLEQQAEDYPEVLSALEGEPAVMRRASESGNIMITVAVPVQRLHRVLGALLLSEDTLQIDRLVEQERVAILEVFAIAFGVTLLLSIFLSSTIARPIRLLSEAADRMRPGERRDISIPDFSSRKDEIGNLSRSLQDMTRALFRQIDLVESFAADVSHEMKNPLTSIRSALETLNRAKDSKTREQLLNIIADDVERLNRLISDISAATRLDAEMSRAQTNRMDLSAFLDEIVRAYGSVRKPGMAAVKAELPVDRKGKRAPVMIDGFQRALGQVMRNLIDNALTFSPAEGEVKVSLSTPDGYAEILVEDEGPGITPDKLQTIFERFYSERPAGEVFGKHSGLGLNISQRIIEGHGGEIFAENRYADGREGPVGARFVVRLPL